MFPSRLAHTTSRSMPNRSRWVAAARAGSGRRPPRRAAGRRRTRLPEGGDAEHVLALDPAQVVARVDPSGLAAARRPAGRPRSSPDEAGHAHRQQLRRVRLDSEPAGQLQPLAQQPGQPVGGVPLGHAEGRLSRVTRASLRPGGRGSGGGAWASSRARSSSRTASALAPSRWATAAPRSYQTIASSASPARSWWAATCAATASGSPACSRSRARATRFRCGAAPGRAEGGVGDLADAVVGEVVGVGALVADDPPPPQLVQAADQGLLVGLAGLGEHVGGELAADGGGHADQVAGRRGQPGQPGSITA